ncbi:hypothetical protein BgiBS90_029591, partial [Biomphalaria glabrata]
RILLTVQTWRASLPVHRRNKREKRKRRKKSEGGGLMKNKSHQCRDSFHVVKQWRIQVKE